VSQGTRFQPGQSGNPGGRPKQRRPNVSAFEIVLDKRMTATLGGKERELTVEEALQQQTLRDALAGKRMAIRKVLKMIEKREAALARKNPEPKGSIKREVHYSADNANSAMQILGIASPASDTDSARWKVHAWAVQAALSRPGTRKLLERNASNVKLFTFDSETLRWPRGRTE
jgi:hypothetical protein